jgi:signal transduction histidine kinase
MIENQAQGLALLCDLQGLILRVLRNDLSLENAAVGQLFFSLVDNASRTKAMNFLTEIKSQGAVLDWEMNVPVAGGLMTLHLAGGSAGSSLLITAGANSKLAERLYGDMLNINNEQANLLRAALKDKQEVASSRAASDPMYDEISRLNNELVAMQRELTGKNVELAKLNALKNQFLGMAAHDLRNPLHGILAYSSLILEDAEALNAEQIEFIIVIHDQTQYMANLVNDLLDVATIESGKLQLDLQPVDLVKIAQTNLNRNRLIAARKNITIDLQADSIPMALFDAAKMEQVLDNLTTNAIKYSPPGSHIQIRLQTSAEEILLSVQDEGPGIPPDEMKKLFKAFQKTSVKSTGGEKSTGLGLAIVKRIVVGHGGRIWVESQLGQGSTFYVAVPISN